MHVTTWMTPGNLLSEVSQTEGRKKKCPQVEMLVSPLTSRPVPPDSSALCDRCRTPSAPSLPHQLLTTVCSGAGGLQGVTVTIPARRSPPPSLVFPPRLALRVTTTSTVFKFLLPF